MSASKDNTTIIHRTEWAVGLFLTILIVYLHVTFMQNAGAFWRDEVHSIQLATMPSLSYVWASLGFDSFPLLSSLVIRLWSSTGFGETYTGLRLLGLLVGLSTIGVIWFNARLFGHSVPLVALALFGFSSLVIRVGDSIRPYGLGIFLIMLTFGLIWRVIESPSPRRIIAATVVSVLSVQCLYTNALLLFAICLGGIVVTLSNAMWKRALVLLGIGIITALSLLPYLGVITNSSDWVVLIQSPNTFKSSWEILSGWTLGSASYLITWIWIILFFVGICIAIYHVFRKPTATTSRKERDITLFFATAMVASTVEFFLFYKIMKVSPVPWYFLYPMAIVALSLDGIFGRNKKLWGIWRIVLSIFIVGLTFNSIWHDLHMRQTNVDIIAARLEESVTKDDFILVNPWYVGITFQKYYKGDAPWMTIPPIEELRTHRYDLLKEKMASPMPLRPVLVKIDKTLKSGNRLWLVGNFNHSYLPRKGKTPPVLPPAPSSRYGWSSGAYLQSWLMQTEYFIYSHAVQYQHLQLTLDGPVNPYENYSVIVARRSQHN
jgi:hypothetical protein